MAHGSLSRTLRTLFSQDVGLRNAALASARMDRERRQRADVDDYLSRLDAHVDADPTPPWRGASAADLDRPSTGSR